MIPYSAAYSNAMCRDVKRVAKRGKDLAKLHATLGLLSSRQPMPAKYRDHALKGRWRGLTGCRECHIESDWLLIYKIFEDELVLLATGTGTHSDLF